MSPPYGYGVCVVRLEPANMRSPLARTTEREFAVFELSLARKPSIVTTSPIFNDCRVQPCRINPFGLPISHAHVAFLPSESATSMYTNAWGFSHSTLETAPVSFTGLFASNSAANE